MVNPETPDTATRPLMQALRREGEKLRQTSYLIKTTPITPLQLLPIEETTDLILASPGQTVAILSDPHGQAAIACATVRPHWNVLGWVPDAKSMAQLQNRPAADNLRVDIIPETDAGQQTRPQAIIASAWAHQVLSQNYFQPGKLLQAVKQLLDLLPEDGQLLIQDFALPDDHDKFVILDLEHDEAIEALLEFSHVARPNAPRALRGFFVEAQPSPRKGVARFRLPMKWAVEFTHRWRHGIAIDAPFELTTFSLTQWQSLIEQCGARATYRAPHHLGRAEAREIGRHIRFMDEHEHPLPLPATHFTLLVEKRPADSTLSFYEHRLSGDKARDILISGIKDADTGDKLDIVEIRQHEDDLLPWYLDHENRLHILIRSNVARPVINTVPRGTPNLDGRQWAGYLTDAIAVPHLAGPLNQALIVQYLRDTFAGFDIPVGEASVGIEYYPAPDYLVQRVRGIFLPIQSRDIALPVLYNGNERMIDVLADDVLQAIGAGLIPDGKLEILIGQLMSELGLTPRDTGKFLKQPEVKRVLKFNRDRREAKMPITLRNGEHLANYLIDSPTGKLRAVRSVFVEDQWGDAGRHIARVTEQDFIVPAQQSANTAICIPMMRDPMGRFLISGEPRKLPIPNRMGTEEPLMHLPGLSLPSTVKTVEQARYFLARQLECDPDDLFPLGPSFFAQPQLSPERIYPFLLNATPMNNRWMRWFRPRGALNRLVRPMAEKSTAYLEFRAARDMGEWYTGFTPDLTTKPGTKLSLNDNLSPTEPGAAALSQHPMITPKPN